MEKRMGRRRHNPITPLHLICWLLISCTIASTASIIILGYIIISGGYGPPMDWDDTNSMELPYKALEPSAVEPPPISSEPAVEVTRGIVERVKMLSINSSVLTPSNISPEKLENCLPDALKPYAGVFTQIEKEKGVNALILCSISALESGNGESELAMSHNNLFGWTDSNSPSGFKYFESKEVCIEYVAEKLKTNYLTEGGKYYNGTTLSDINKRYCSRQDWADRVFSLVDQYQNTIINQNNQEVLTNE